MYETGAIVSLNSNFIYTKFQLISIGDCWNWCVKSIRQLRFSKEKVVFSHNPETPLITIHKFKRHLMNFYVLWRAVQRVFRELKIKQNAKRTARIIIIIIVSTTSFIQIKDYNLHFGIINTSQRNALLLSHTVVRGYMTYSQWNCSSLAIQYAYSSPQSTDYHPFPELNSNISFQWENSMQIQNPVT